MFIDYSIIENVNVKPNKKQIFYKMQFLKKGNL